MPAGRMYNSSKPITVIAKKPPSRLQKVVKDVAKLKKVVNKDPEFKYWDYVPGILTISTTPIVLALNSAAIVTQGTTAITYTGGQYRVKSIQMSANIIYGGAATANDECKIALVRYKPANQVLPTYSGGLNGIYATASTLAYRQLNNRNDFIVLKEWNLVFNDFVPFSRRIDYYKKLNLVTTVASGDTLEPEENAYYLVAYGNTAVGTSLITINSTFRFRFTDD